MTGSSTVISCQLLVLRNRAKNWPQTKLHSRLCARSSPGGEAGQGSQDFPRKLPRTPRAFRAFLPKSGQRLGGEAINREPCLCASHFFVASGQSLVFGSSRNKRPLLLPFLYRRTPLPKFHLRAFSLLLQSDSRSGKSCVPSGTRKGTPQ